MASSASKESGQLLPDFSGGCVLDYGLKMGPLAARTPYFEGAGRGEGINGGVALNKGEQLLKTLF